MPTILHLDTAETHRRTRSALLAAGGFGVVEAADAGEALRRLELLPDLVLIASWCAPNSPDLCRRVKARSAGTGVLVLCETEGEHIQALDAGADVCLTEPVETGRLLAQLRAMSRRGAGDVGRAPSREARAEAGAPAGQLLWAVLESMEELIAALDGDFRYLACNRAYRKEFREVFGTAIEVGSSIVDALGHLGAEREAAVAVWRRALQGEDFVQMAEFGVPPNRRTYEMRFSPMRDARGAIVGAIELARDVTERVRAAQEMRGSEERLSAAVEGGNLGTWDLDLTTDVAVRSARHDEIWGYGEPQREWGLEIAMRHVVPEDRPGIKAAYARAIETGALSHENRIVWPDGSIHWIAANGRVRYDANGRAVRVTGVVADITERKTMEERLQSIAQFPQENPGPVLRVGQGGHVLYANPAAAGLLADMQGDSVEACPRELREAMEQALGSGRELDVEVRCAKGRIFSFACVPVSARGYANLYGRDVTEAKRAGQALEDSERRFRGTFENAAVGIAHIDREGRFLRVNERFRQMQRQRCEELIGRRFADLMHPEDRAEDVARFAAMMRGEAESQVLEKRHLRTDGSFFWVLVTRSLQRDEAGRPAYAISIVQDITDRKRAEGALRQSEVFYRQTLESIPGMVFTTRADGYCDYQSQQWVDYAGVPLAEMLGDGWNRLLHPDDQPRALAAWRAAVEGTAPYDLEYRVRRRDGQYEWFKVNGRPIRDAEGEVVRWFGVALNIEELKRTHEALTAARISAEHAKAAAEEASAAKDHFLAVLSHELRTPLAPVVTGLALLENQLGLSEQARSVLQVVRRNVDLESRLIDDLLDLTRVARGRVELDKHLVELCTIIDRAIEVCRPDIEARGLHFGVDYGPRPYLVEADAARLQQVFWNVLKNAIKFTPHGGCVGFRCRRDNGHVVVEVSDSGVGIDPAELERIFDAFAQAERSLGRQFGGLGLGLAISKALVEMHGGRIDAHSEGRNRGATFRVRLPVAVGAEAVQPQLAGGMRPAPAAGGLAPLHVLVVEDHGDSADMLAAMLKLEGHRVVKAADVATALDIIGRERYDMLLSDLGLPDRSGLDLIREVRSRGLRLPAIALSGYGQERDIEQSRAAGFAEHLVKPVDPVKLLEAMRRLVSPS